MLWWNTRTYTRLVARSLTLAGVLALALGSGGQAQASGTTPLGLGNGGVLGPILTDAQGETLYTFMSDAQGTSTCNDLCATVWPPLLADGDPVAPPAAVGTFGTTTRQDGGQQVTFNGMPLYRYSGDAHPGDSNGQQLFDFGGTWFVVSPSAQ